MRTTSLAALFLTLGIASAACNNSSTPTTLSTTTTIANEVFTGTVQPPVNGVLQSAFNAFDVGQGRGAMSITLTSAVKTLPGATLLTTVTMGLSVGSLTADTCTPVNGGFTTAQAGSTPQLSGTLSGGSYCVLVSDVTNQLGPVSYAVAVSHP